MARLVLMEVSHSVARSGELGVFAVVARLRPVGVSTSLARSSGVGDYP